MPFQDFTKLECPFVRKTYNVKKEDWKLHGSALQMREPEVYLVTPQVTTHYEWVMEHPSTYAVEKLNGSNVGILTENGRLIEVQNRANIIDPLLITKGKFFLMEGIFNAIGKGYVEQDGLQFGELLGPKLQTNPYRIDLHLWYPFTKARQSLRYRSFDEHPRCFWGWNEWFRMGLKSRFALKTKKFTEETLPFAEGVVFTNDVIGIEGHPRMAKLRRDMMPWYYWDKIEILGLEDHWIEFAKSRGIPLPKGYQ